MIIEIRRAGFINKGAELMLHAIIQKLRERYPDATLVMAPTPAKGSQPFCRFTKLGIFPKAFLWHYGIQWGDLARFLPKKLREMYGLILDKDVDVVLDAAGFAYSDQWGSETSKELAASSNRWKKRGTKIILLPQAFGPFKSHGIQSHVKVWSENADLIFAREIDSYKYLTEVCGESERIKMAPDFTNLISGILPEYHDVESLKVALIPNYRMIDKTARGERELYLPFMVACAKYLIERKAKLFILVHEGEKDMHLASQISDRLGGIPIVSESDPIKIKGILGACQATIGSRFHGLVSALSQGVPSLAVGWSHKYLRLFEDYGFPEGILSVSDDDAKIRAKIDLILDGTAASGLRERLLKASAKLKSRSVNTWDLVFDQIDLAMNRRKG